MQTPDGEELVEIPGHAGYYATRSGQIWSAKQGLKRMKTRKDRRTRHLRVQLYEVPPKRRHGTAPPKEHRRYYVHRLVALTFLPPPEEGDDLVRHLDGEPLNNAVENLAWGDVYDNQADRREHLQERLLEQIAREREEETTYVPDEELGF